MRWAVWRDHAGGLEYLGVYKGPNPPTVGQEVILEGIPRGEHFVVTRTLLEIYKDDDPSVIVHLKTAT